MIIYGFAAALFFATSSAGAPASPRTLAVQRTSSPPIVDGDLADSCWRSAAPVTGFVRLNGKPPAEQTTASITYDAANLYIAFICDAKSPGKLKAGAEGRDSDLIFGDDNVELFLDANCDRATYFHFAINPAAARYEASCDMTDGDLVRKEEWNGKWQVETRITDRSWTAEISIPFAALGAASPAPGSVWGVNFCRSWRVTPDGEFSKWSGKVGFNRPAEFGLAVFGVEAGSARFDEAMRKAADAIRRAADGGPAIDLRPDRYYYPADTPRMTLEIDASAQRAVTLDLLIRKDAPADPVFSAELPLIDGATDVEYDVEIGPWPLGRYVVSAHLRDGNGEVLHAAHRIVIKRRLDPAPAPPSAIDATIRSDGIILLDGKPFCPFVAEGWSPASPLAKDSFNLSTYGDLGTLAIADPLAWPRLNLPWVTRTEEGAVIMMPEKEAMYEGIRKEVMARKTDPTLLCRLLKYEAHLPMYRGTVENRKKIDNVQECREINAFVKRVDPHHLTSIHVDRPKYLGDYKDVADIVEIAYWSSSYAPSLIPNLTRDLETVRRVIGPGRAFKFWIGGTIPSPKKRSAEVIRCACYLTLMRGAAGIGFNMGHGGLDPSHTRHWSVYAGLYRELMELFSILTTIQEAPAPRFAIDAREIEFTVRRRGDRIYLVAVNTSKRPIRATVTVPDDAFLSNGIRLPFEHRTIHPDQRDFRELFTAYEPHVYEFALSP